MTDPSAAVEKRSEEDIRESVESIILELAPSAEGQQSEEKRLVEDFGFHSLALLELAFTLEDEFDLPPIDEATAQQITTIDAIAQHVITTLREQDGIAE